MWRLAIEIIGLVLAACWLGILAVVGITAHVLNKVESKRR